MSGQPPRTVEWVGDAERGHLRLLDQTKLPGEVAYLDCRDVEAVWGAIRRLSVRGAPAIGVAAAYGCVMGAQRGDFEGAASHLARSRPTAVNLFRAIERMRAVGAAPGCRGRGTADAGRLLAEARAIHEEDRRMCERIGRHAAGLIRPGGGVLTHCNAGALATVGIGTATAPMYVAHRAGVRFRVYAGETRPLLQGARLTAWELSRAGIAVTVVCDDAAASLMRRGEVQMVITGADRIAANGDVANKIGTYMLAVAARHHGLPFYVAAPSTTFDLGCAGGEAIPIEERDGAEVTDAYAGAESGSRSGAEESEGPAGGEVGVGPVRVYNPAFDVTPAELVTALITERGVIQPVEAGRIREMIGEDSHAGAERGSKTGGTTDEHR